LPTSISWRDIITHTNTSLSTLLGDLQMKFVKGLAYTGTLSGLLLATLAPFLANAQSSTTNVGQSITPQAASQAVNEYWSAARLQSAKPADVSVKGGPKAAVSVQSLSQPGVPASAPGGAPGQAVTNAAPINQAAKPQPVDLKYPFPYTRGFVSYDKYTQYPHKTIGKIFFTKVSDGKDYVCSGSAVNSTNKRLIVTAGHCVSDGKGNFHKNVIFVPAYNPNNSSSSQREPYGRWSSCYLTTRSAWHSKGDFGQDIGMIKACDKGTSKLHDKIGYLGYKANVSRNQTWNAFGYPQAAPFDGKKLTYCKAAYATSDTQFSPDTIGIGCDMTGGSSGGPWILNYTPGQSGSFNYINGLNSYKYDSQPKAMYSPYFGNEFLDLRKFAIDKGA
jgi:V8-like Glu-specific endopeptidase